jgi:DNA-binding Xre family transcriptional regulator
MKVKSEIIKQKMKELGYSYGSFTKVLNAKPYEIYEAITDINTKAELLRLEYICHKLGLDINDVIEPKIKESERHDPALIEEIFSKPPVKLDVIEQRMKQLGYTYKYLGNLFYVTGSRVKEIIKNGHRKLLKLERICQILELDITDVVEKEYLQRPTDELIYDPKKEPQQTIDIFLIKEITKNAYIINFSKTTKTGTMEKWAYVYITCGNGLDIKYKEFDTKKEAEEALLEILKIHEEWAEAPKKTIGQLEDLFSEPNLEDLFSEPNKESRSEGIIKKYLELYEKVKEFLIELGVYGVHTESVKEFN